jgi:DNA helicase-2/ATP-dependent DNA helicase PcrA
MPVIFLKSCLKTHDRGFLIPAHIWTPWFSLLGSKSGFDTVEHCFGDLTNHIFALETGLSSDPPMNRRVSMLDRFTLVSNSDAHSPAKLGREANCFDTEWSYTAIYTAMKTADPEQFLGTIEFYPEEGKYHVDGHRKCAFRCHPEETRRLDGRCPKCGKPLTRGVLYRVEALSDRSKEDRFIETSSYRSLIPLTDLLSEVLEVGPNTKKVKKAYDQLIRDYGSELDLLCNVPVEAFDTCGISLFGESIRRMRNNEVYFNPGYDGEFGRVCIFKPGERQKLQGQRCLFDIADEKPAVNFFPPHFHQASFPSTGAALQSALSDKRDTGGMQLNTEQQSAVDHGKGPLIISAGPGTGKTRTITCRMAALLEKGMVRPEQMLAVTFTNQAAQEMRRRLEYMLPSASDLPRVNTFHGFCLHMLKEVYENQAGGVLNEYGRRNMVDDAVVQAAFTGYTGSLSTDTIVDCIIQAKQHLLGPRDDLTVVAGKKTSSQVAIIYSIYQDLLKIQGLYDYEDLLFQVINLLNEDGIWRKTVQKRYRYIFVDEFQDINMAQYRLLQAIVPKESNLCVIGDPDQAIYGFRGSDSRYFNRFRQDFKGTRTISLKQNYRSAEPILDASFQVINQGKSMPGDVRNRTWSRINGYPAITIVETASERAEAVSIGRTIEKMIGGISFHSIDFGKVKTDMAASEHTFGDFGVLCRTGHQAQFIADKLISAGIPCQLASKHIHDSDSVLKLLAAFRVISGTGAYVDLNFLTGLHAAAISKETLSIFKQWAYGKRLPLATARLSVKRIPIPGMSQRRQVRLVALFDLLDKLGRDTAEMDVANTLKAIVSNTTLSARMPFDQLQQLVDQAMDHKHQSGVFVSALALEQDADLYRTGVEKVAVMTIHASKGLEFNTVFIAGCEAGLLPYERAGSKTKDIEEERRLLYVAMTRARKRLFCTWARKRSLHGKTLPRRLSPFIETIEEKLKHQINERTVHGKPRQEQLSLF